MPLIAGIDIGNASTEVALAEHGRFIGSGIVATTGMKGTPKSCKYFKIPLAVLSSIEWGTDAEVFIPPIKSNAFSIAVGMLLSLKLTT